MLRDIVDFLTCPHCGDDLALGSQTVRCQRGHAFDVARHGYVNLLPGAAGSDAGDSRSMVAARESFLGAGHFAPIRDQVVETAAQVVGLTKGCIVDVGAGTGYYLGGLLDVFPSRVGVALDVSKYAVRRVARAHPRAGAAVCDVWRSLPVQTDVAGLVLNVFSPRNALEFNRILEPDGALVVVVPTQRHLEEVVDALGLLTVDEDKDARVHDQLDPYFEEVMSPTCEISMTLDPEDVAALIAMGPSAWHVDAGAIEERVGSLPSALSVTASVVVSVYRPV